MRGIRASSRGRVRTDHGASDETNEQRERPTQRAVNVGHEAVARGSELPQIVIGAQRDPAHDEALAIKIRWRPARRLRLHCL